MAGLTDKVKAERTTDISEGAPVQNTDEKLITKVKCTFSQYAFKYILYVQEVRETLLSATVNGDVEVVSTLINSGVDMNAVIHEVCYTALGKHNSIVYFISAAK